MTKLALCFFKKHQKSVLEAHLSILLKTVAQRNFNPNVNAAMLSKTSLPAIQ
jgi:hypothetical protein